jgi:hypothetical protein
MNLQRLSFMLAIAVATFTVGCAAPGRPTTAPPVALQGTADAVIYISGLSCPF